MAITSPRQSVIQRGAFFSLDFSGDVKEQVRQIATYLQALDLNSSVSLPSYTVSTVPPAADHSESLIYVSDESGGAVPAFSDGTDWRRCTDRAVIS